MAITFVWTRFPFDQQFRSDVWWSTVAGCALRSKKLLLGSPPNVRGWSSPDRLQATRRRSVTQTLQVQGNPGGRRGWGFFSGTHLGPLCPMARPRGSCFVPPQRADEGYEGPSSVFEWESGRSSVSGQLHQVYEKSSNDICELGCLIGDLNEHSSQLAASWMVGQKQVTF